VEQFAEYKEFMKVNRSYLVNLTYVVAITSGPNLQLSNGESIPISHQTAKEVRRRLDNLNDPDNHDE